MSSANHTSRRMMLLSTLLGAGGVAAGLATQMWFNAAKHDAPQPKASADPALQALWDLPLSTTSGQAWDWAATADAPLLINFWATWCPPCVEELPLLDKAALTLKAQAEQRSRDQQKLHPAQLPEIVLIAIDTPANVQRFLSANRLQLPSLMAGGAAIATTKALGNAAGGLPFSVLLSADRRILQRKAGKLSEAEIFSWLAATA